MKEPAAKSVTTGKILIIAEKPSVGRAISQALGTGERGDTFRHRKEGYIEGERYTITWCIGHLVEPLEPEGYDERYKSWSSPATRAEIIEKLCKSGYLKREKKNLRATALGEKLIHLVPEKVKSVDLSVEWENNLTRINRGEMDPDAFLAEIEAMVRELVEDYRELAEEVKARRKIIPVTAEYIGDCPNCGGGIVKGKYGPYCKNECGMRLDYAYGKRLTETQIIALLKGDSINVTLKSRKGKDFDAILTPKGVKPYTYEKDGNELTACQYDFDMEFAKK